MRISDHGPHCMYEDVRLINRWLDDQSGDIPGDTAMRVMKLMEECGEVSSAFIGMTGQNPRKGVTHTQQDLMNELSDVVVTALCAMQHLSQDSRVVHDYITNKLTFVMQRAGIPGHDF